MILIQIARSLIYLFGGTSTRPKEKVISHVSSDEDVSDHSKLAQQIKDQYAIGEKQIGLHFKMLNFLCTIFEQNFDMIKKNDDDNSIESLSIFSAFFRLQFLQQLLSSFLDKVSSIVIQSEDPFQEELKFNEHNFIEKCSSPATTLCKADLGLWVSELQTQFEYAQKFKTLTEEDLIPTYDLLSQLFEDSIEAYLENGELTIKELQSYYKIRTKILHRRINELNKLVDDQTNDIKETRSQYTDDLITIKDEVSDLKNMASHLETLQQSQDFYMNGAYISNNINDDISNDSFYNRNGRPSVEGGLFKQTKPAQSNRMMNSIISKDSNQKSYNTQGSSNNFRSTVNKRQEVQKESFGRENKQLFRISTENAELQMNQEQDNNSRSTSQLSGCQSPYQDVFPQSTMSMRSTIIPSQQIYADDQESEGGQYGGNQSKLNDKLHFSQSPIHFDQPTSTIFSRNDVHHMIHDPDFFQNYDSNKKSFASDECDTYALIGQKQRLNEQLVTEFNRFEPNNDRSKKNTLGGLKIAIPFSNIEKENIEYSRNKAKQQSSRNTGWHLTSKTQENASTQELNNHQESDAYLESQERDNYLDGSLEMASDMQNERVDLIQDFQESLKSPTEKQIQLTIKRIIQDRMTPEFKLNSEDGRSSSAKNIKSETGKSKYSWKNKSGVSSTTE